MTHTKTSRRPRRRRSRSGGHRHACKLTVALTSPAAFVVDDDARERFVYVVGVHAQRLSVSLHALSLDDAGFTLIATAPRAFVRRDFVHRVRRDLAGALSPSEAGPPLRFGPAQVEPLRTADDHLEAYVDLMVSDPYCITPFTREGGGGVPWRRWPA